MCIIEFVLFLTHTRCVKWHYSRFLQPNLMAGNNSSGSDHARDDVQGMEVLRANLLTQETALRALADNVDCIFQAFEGRFDEITDRIDALAIGANKGGNEDRRRLKDEVAQGQPVNRHVPAHHRRQPVYSDDSEDEEDFLYANHRPARGGGRRDHGYERNSGDFKLKVGIPSFSGNFNIEDFIDWIAEIDKFFDYMEVLEEKRMKLVAYRLKGGTST